MKNLKMKPQEWYIRSLIEILKNKDNYYGDFKKDIAYTYVLNSFADKYSNTFFFKDKNGNSKLFNMYWGSFDPRNNYEDIVDSIIISKAAYEYLKSEELSKCKTKTAAKPLLKRYLHLEHLTPMSYSWRKALELKTYTEDTIKECFRYAVVSLISKEESKLLDSNALLEEKDIDLLTKLSKKYPEIKDEEIEEAKDLLNKKIKLKANGNGLIRLIHLYNNKDGFFVDRNGVEIDIYELYNRLKANKFELHQYR